MKKANLFIIAAFTVTVFGFAAGAAMGVAVHNTAKLIEQGVF